MPFGAAVHQTCEGASGGCTPTSKGAPRWRSITPPPDYAVLTGEPARLRRQERILTRETAAETSVHNRTMPLKRELA